MTADKSEEQELREWRHRYMKQIAVTNLQALLRAGVRKIRVMANGKVLYEKDA